MEQDHCLPNSPGERSVTCCGMKRNRPTLFKGRHFEAKIIMYCVRWYLRKLFGIVLKVFPGEHLLPF
jgi:hypothetical protein